MQPAPGEWMEFHCPDNQIKISLSVKSITTQFHQVPIFRRANTRILKKNLFIYNIACLLVVYGSSLRDSLKTTGNKEWKYNLFCTFCGLDIV